jgi:hypothetical protein
MFNPMDIHSRNLRQKAEKGKFTCSEATTSFPRASYFKKPARSVPETRGRITSLECQWYEKWDKKLDSYAVENVG